MVAIKIQPASDQGQAWQQQHQEKHGDHTRAPIENAQDTGETQNKTQHNIAELEELACLWVAEFFPDRKEHPHQCQDHIEGNKGDQGLRFNLSRPKGHQAAKQRNAGCDE